MNPYLAPAATALDRGTSRADVGALMILLASGLGPLVLHALFATMSIMRLGTLDPRWIVDFSGLGTLAAPLGVMLGVGVYLLTDKRRFEMISGELRAVTRVAAIVHALTLILTVVSYLRRHWIDYTTFEHGSHFTGNAADALLSLLVASHLTLVDSRGTARASRWLAAAMLAAIVAEILLTRETRDELFNLVPPQHAYLVLPMNVVLCIGKLVVFGKLWRELAKRARSVPSQETSE